MVKEISIKCMRQFILVCLGVFAMLFIYRETAFAAAYIYDYDQSDLFEEASGEKVWSGHVFVEGDVIKTQNGGCIIWIEKGTDIEEYSISPSDGESAAEQFVFGRGIYTYKMKDDGMLIFVCVDDGQDNAADNEDKHHRHTYKTNLQEATESQDGWIEVVCEECGYVKESGPLSALDVFWAGAFEKVKSALPGETVIIESDIWHSLPSYVMEAIAERRDISVVCRMEYEHQKYEVMISPEESVEYTDAYYGVLYLVQLYGGKSVQ